VTSSKEITRTAFDSKPDPDEPWRFTCPECDSQVYRHERKKTYNCQKCGGNWKKRDLNDKSVTR
jgi:hypothetical protein